MSDYFIPEIKQRLNIHTVTAQDGNPNVLMEDTVYIMDDATAVMGGPTTPEGPMPLTVARLRIGGR